MDTEHRPQPDALPPGQGWIYRDEVDFVVKAGELRRRGEEPPDHTHPTEDEMFYVLEGALTARCGGQTFELDTGAFIFLPFGVQHGYTISNNDPVRLLVITAPLRPASDAGWDGFIGSLEAGLAERIALPPDIA